MREKFGIAPESIPDYLALVGDTADGFPGLPGWGAKSASVVLAKYLHLEDIPLQPSEWEVPVRGAGKLAATLAQQFEQALLFRRIATLETDVAVGVPAEWEWTGPTAELEAYCERIDAPDVLKRTSSLAAARFA